MVQEYFYEMKAPEDKYGNRFANTGKVSETTSSKDFNFHVENSSIPDEAPLSLTSESRQE